MKNKKLVFLGITTLIASLSLLTGIQSVTAQPSPLGLGIKAKAFQVGSGTDQWEFYKESKVLIHSPTVTVHLPNANTKIKAGLRANCINDGGSMNIIFKTKGCNVEMIFNQNIDFNDGFAERSSKIKNIRSNVGRFGGKQAKNTNKENLGLEHEVGKFVEFRNTSRLIKFIRNKENTELIVWLPWEGEDEVKITFSLKGASEKLALIN